MHICHIEISAIVALFPHIEALYFITKFKTLYLLQKYKIN